MTDEELKSLVASLAVAQQETDRLLKEQSRKTDEQFRKTDEQIKETNLQLQETKEIVKETSRQIQELKKQIGGLSNKFGGFAEGMALPSMTKLLWEKFQMEVVSPRHRVRKNGEEIELDVLAYANTTVNAVYVVEVKSLLDERAIKQMLSILKRFPYFFPEHHDKELYGILAIVDSKKDIPKQALDEGLYVASIHDDLFELTVPDDFTPKSFSVSN